MVIKMMMKKLAWIFSVWLGAAAHAQNIGAVPAVLEPLHMPGVGHIRQMALDERGALLVVNAQGQLWRREPHATGVEKLLSGISGSVAPVAGHGKIAVADNQGRFLLWQAGRVVKSDIVLAPDAGMVVLPFAVIAVARHDNENRLVRLEEAGGVAKITAMADTPVLPDSHPVQINFAGDNSQGHIAVLARPDGHTYRHGVLGDAIEAGELQYLERHSLQPLAAALAQRGMVLEGNRLQVLPRPVAAGGVGHEVVAVMAGNGSGGRTVRVGQQGGQLRVVAQSAALPQNRWQSPFVWQGRLYAVQMPHLAGRLVMYTGQGGVLEETLLGQGLSNHEIGSRETNLAAGAADFAVVPGRDLRSLYVLNAQGALGVLKTLLPATVLKTVAVPDRVYTLLSNGEVWQVRREK